MIIRECDTMINQRRIEAIKLADAINSIEGVPVRAYAKELSMQWAMGNITGEQMKAAIAVSHKQLAMKSRKHNG
jgi:hypothetical protein